MSWRDRPEPIPEERIEETLTADVVIVGLGYAGTAALRAAAEAGVSVIGLELMTRNKYMSYGRDVGHINSRFLESRGVPHVDPIDLYNEQLRRAGNRANPSLLMQFAQNCGEAFDWFTDMYGIEGLRDVHVAYWPEGAEKFKAHPGADYNGYHFWNGTAQFPDPHGWPGSPTLPDVVRANWAKAEEHGARLYFSMTAEQPVMDGSRVAGVIARNAVDGTYRRFTAKKGVLLAAGDFAGNQEMLDDLITDTGDLLREGQRPPLCIGRKGWGHRIGLWAGGRLEPRPLPAMGGNYPTIPGFTTFGVLWLDSRGRRFCNETLGGPEFAFQPVATMPGGTFYNIFDEHIEEDLQWAVPAHQGFDASDPQFPRALRDIMKFAAEEPKGGERAVRAFASVVRGPVDVRICSGETPEELADNIGLTDGLRESFIASIRRYNDVCAAGRDDDFGKDEKLLRPLSGRLFAQVSEPMTNIGIRLVTVGGLVTDETQNVLNRNFDPIPGLYATGNCCGRRFGSMYTTPISGISIGTAVTLGRLAGQNIAAAPAE